MKYPLFWITLAALPVFLWGLGSPSLNDGECGYVEIAREMRLFNDWVTPRLNGCPHFDKPPLLYWLIGFSQGLMGETEAAARIWPALATWATIPIVGLIGISLYGARAGWLAALVFAASLGPFLFGRLVMTDPLLGFWIALAILGYSRGYARDGSAGGGWRMVMFAAMGFACLTKGIVGIGFPAAVIGLHAMITGRLRRFFTWHLAAGILLLIAIAAPWHIAVAKVNPDFLGYYFIREHFERFTGRRFPRDEFLSLPGFLALTLLWTLPWCTLVPLALWRAMKGAVSAAWRRGSDVLPLLWILVIVGLFSLSSSRLEYYALPSLPAFALLMGKLWDGAFSGGSDQPPRYAWGAGLGALAAVSAIAAVAVLVVLGPAKEAIFKFIIDQWPTSGWTGSPEQVAVLDRIRMPAIAAMVGVAILTSAALALFQKRRVRWAFGLLCAMMLLLFPMVQWGLQVTDPFHSTWPIADMVNRTARPEDLVVYQEPHEYMFIGGIAYHTKRLVHILRDPRYDGLAARPREPAELFLSLRQLEGLWGSDRRVFVIARSQDDPSSELEKAGPVRLLGRAGDLILIENATAAGAAIQAAPE